jgi:hypothetical protein
MQVPIGFRDHLRAGQVKNRRVNKAARMSWGTIRISVHQLSLRIVGQEKGIVIQKMNGYVSSKAEPFYRC